MNGMISLWVVENVELPALASLFPVLLRWSTFVEDPAAVIPFTVSRALTCYRHSSGDCHAIFLFDR